MLETWGSQLSSTSAHQPYRYVQQYLVGCSVNDSRLPIRVRVAKFNIHPSELLLLFFVNIINTGLLKMIVGVLTTYTQYTGERGVCSCTYGLRNSQSFLSWCAVSSSYAFLRLECSLLRWRRTAIETIDVDMLQIVWNELDYRIDVCRITEGAHIEHL
jgi:hypothetical protein